MTRTAFARIATAALGAGIALAGAPALADSIIRNVTVVETLDGSLSPGRALVIRDGLIAAVLPDAEVQPAPSDRVIDAAGAYVVPGYVDMHAHGLVGPARDAGGDHVHVEPAAGQAAYNALFLANGVTGFRQMSGTPELVELARAMNAASAAGALAAPEVVQVPAGLMAGQIATPEAGVALVEAQIAAGGDFLKIVGGRPDVVIAMLTHAAARDFPVAGHLPPAVPTEKVARIGWRAVEHLGATPGMLIDCAGAAPMIRARMAEAGPPPALPPTFLLSPLLYLGGPLSPAMEAILGSYQPEACADLARVFVETGTWHVPTLIRLRTMAQAGSATFRDDPRLRYLPRADRALWADLGAQFSAATPPDRQQVFDAFYALQQRVTGMLQTAGVPMLAGSDVGGMWILPGFGLHDEFAELAGAGFSPLEILQATTLNAARFLGREGAAGRVAEGHAADLVLLSANPLEDAANLAAIVGVMRAGHYHDRAALDALLTGVEAANAD